MDTSEMAAPAWNSPAAILPRMCLWARPRAPRLRGSGAGLEAMVFKIRYCIQENASVCKRQMIPRSRPDPKTADRSIECELKAALRGGRRLYGTLVTSASPKSIEALAGLDLDCVMIDTEHIPMGWHDLGWMCRAYRSLGIVPI